MPLPFNIGTARALLANLGLTYLFRDEFTTDVVAGGLNGTSAEPGPGTRIATDTDSKLSVSGGKRVLASGSSNAPREFIQVSRAAGRALFTQLNYSAAAIRIGYGDLTNADSQKRGAFFVSTTSSGVYDGNAVLITSILNLAVNTDYQFCVILLSTGEYYFVKGGAFTNWTLVWVGTVGTTTPLYAGINGHSSGGAGSSDYDRVRDLPAPFTGSLATVAVTSFTQSLGSELLTNGDFAAWSGDNPTGWTVGGETGSDPMVTESSGKARLVSSATNNAPTLAQTVATVGGIYEVGVNITTLTSGALRALFSAQLYDTTTSGVKRTLMRADATTLTIAGRTPAIDLVIDDATLKRVTLNAAQTVPADGIFDLLFTVPASPVAGQEIHLLYRINASGDEFNNCWDLYIRRNDGNTDWDIRLDSISAGTRTNRVSSTGLGSNPTALRVICEGNLHDVYVLLAGGWLKRGSQINNSTFATATLANSIYSTGFTPSALNVYPRTSAVFTAELDKV